MNKDKIQEELVMKPVCHVCDTVVDVWNDNISNAWQLHGRNHYEFTCPECQTKQVFSIEIENESTDQPLGLYIMPHLTGRNIINESGKTD